MAAMLVRGIRLGRAFRFLLNQLLQTIKESPLLTQSRLVRRAQKGSLEKLPPCLRKKDR